MYEKWLRPLLFRFGSDHIHELTIKGASLASRSEFLCNQIEHIANALSQRNSSEISDATLTQKLFGLTFRNPIGLAAGFDKNGTLPTLFYALGFGFEEVGSITANPSNGNPLPRSFRLTEDYSLINRMGLNNEGAKRITDRLRTLPSLPGFPLGINIAKTHDPKILGEDGVRDYLISYRFAEIIADYITINISCPNTTEGKTFEDPKALDELLNTLPIHDSLPVLIKFSPDLSRTQLKELLDVTDRFAIAGFVATNTSSGRDGLSASSDYLTKIGRGGLSGRAIRKKSTQLIEWIHEERPDQPIIGVGGIETLQDVIEKIKAGASLLQCYTALVYYGPFIASKLNGQLSKYMNQKGYHTVQEIQNS